MTAPERAEAMAVLASMQGQPVTRELLASTGLGKHMARLAKHQDAQLAAAAAAVVFSWKERLLSNVGL